MILGCAVGASAASVATAAVVEEGVLVEIIGGRDGAGETEAKLIADGVVERFGNVVPDDIADAGTEGVVADGLITNGDESEEKKLLGRAEDVNHQHRVSAYDIA